MTAVIIQFQPLLTERFQSKIIEDNCADELITSKKRRASPTSNDEVSTDSSKRIKTDAEEDAEA